MGIYWNCLLQAFSEHWIQPATQGPRAFFCPRRRRPRLKMRKQGKNDMFYGAICEIASVAGARGPAKTAPQHGANAARSTPDRLMRGAANRSPAPFAAVREKSAPAA